MMYHLHTKVPDGKMSHSCKHSSTLPSSTPSIAATITEMLGVRTGLQVPMIQKESVHPIYVSVNIPDMVGMGIGIEGVGMYGCLLRKMGVWKLIRGSGWRMERWFRA